MFPLVGKSQVSALILITSCNFGRYGTQRLETEPLPIAASALQILCIALTSLSDLSSFHSLRFALRGCELTRKCCGNRSSDSATGHNESSGLCMNYREVASQRFIDHRTSILRRRF